MIQCMNILDGVWIVNMRIPDRVVSYDFVLALSVTVMYRAFFLRVGAGDDNCNPINYAAVFRGTLSKLWCGYDPCPARRKAGSRCRIF